jgi:hypothetical protein
VLGSSRGYRYVHKRRRPFTCLHGLLDLSKCLTVSPSSGKGIHCRRQQDVSNAMRFRHPGVRHTQTQKKKGQRRLHDCQLCSSRHNNLILYLADEFFQKRKFYKNRFCLKWFQQFSTRSNSMATLVYFSRKIDTWKQRFPFNRFAHRRRRKTPGDTNNTHIHTNNLSESLRNSLVDKTTPKLIIHLVLDFHFFSAKIKLSIAKKWRHTSMTHSPLYLQKPKNL